jgi:hypothetical protein
MKQKLYCVHVYERAYEYENVKAVSPARAEAQIVQREWAGNYDDISSIEVMRQCECGLDNDVERKKCDACGANL